MKDDKKQARAILKGHYYCKFERMAYEKGLFSKDEDFDDADYREVYKWEDHCSDVLEMIDRCCDDMMHYHKIVYKELQDFNV